MAGKIDIDVLTTTSSEPLKFAKISEIEKVTTVYPEDYLLLSNDNDGNDKTRSVRLTDIAAYFSNVNTNMQWFIPVVKDNLITWEWSSIVDSIPSIDVKSIIGLADNNSDGLMSALDKAKLDSITLSQISKIPTCTKCTLSASGWDSTTLTQKVSININVDNRNAIDYPAGYNQVVSDCGIYAFREESDGITFKCTTKPTSDVVVYVTSMNVT